ncbi:hypothetical protein CCP4SC76_6490002 [Gammaproteobacteria bacterium]
MKNKSAINQSRPGRDMSGRCALVLCNTMNGPTYSGTDEHSKDLFFMERAAPRLDSIGCLLNFGMTEKRTMPLHTSHPGPSDVHLAPSPAWSA